VNILLVLFSWSLSLSLTYDWSLNCKCSASMVPNQCMLSSSMKSSIKYFRSMKYAFFASMKILENRCVNM